MLKIYSDIAPNAHLYVDYRYNACASGVKEKVVEMAINSRGIRETALVLKIDKNTVISILKSKEAEIDE